MMPKNRKFPTAELQSKDKTILKVIKPSILVTTFTNLNNPIFESDFFILLIFYFSDFALHY